MLNLWWPVPLLRGTGVTFAIAIGVTLLAALTLCQPALSIRISLIGVKRTLFRHVRQAEAAAWDIQAAARLIWDESRRIVSIRFPPLLSGIFFFGAASARL